MPFTSQEVAKCTVCNNLVNASDEMLAAGQKFHKGCFKCSLCRTQLDNTIASEHAGELFCKQCHGRKYGPKGYGFGTAPVHPSS